MSVLANVDVARELLSHREAEELVAYEAVIQDGIVGFQAVGSALLAIRDGRLYRSTHATFEEYTRERWGVSRRYANMTIEAAKIANDLGTNGSQRLIKSERQLRPLAALPESERAAAWEEATEGGSVEATAARVRAAVDRRTRGPSNGPVAAQDDPTEAELADVGGDDPDASGGILAGVVPTVLDLGEGDSDEDAAEAAAERAAIQAESAPQTDDEWVAQFPAYGQLEGMNRRTFREDAVAWRDLQADQRAYAAKVQERANKVRKMGSWMFSQRIAIRKPGPDRWTVCPPVDQGGCGGTGKVEHGNCPTCFANGYVINAR